MTVTIEEAAPCFAELIRLAQSGDEVSITEGNAAVVRISAPPLPDLTNASDRTLGLPLRQPGSAKGLILYMANDFDAPLDDFADYR